MTQLTLPTGTDGQFLFIVYVTAPSSNDNANIGGLYTTTQSAQLTLVYVNGSWYVVSVKE